MRKVHIITPVKNAPVRTAETIEALYNSSTAADWHYTVYDDRSDEPTAQMLRREAAARGFELVTVAERCTTPSPNYRQILIWAQQTALRDRADLLIVESDVKVAPDTIEKMTVYADHNRLHTAMVAAITVDDSGTVNYPYLYAQKHINDGKFNRHVSFCCTLLTYEFLSSVDFEKLDTKKNFFDVMLSHRARRMGMKCHLLGSTPVVHHPNSSRPDKALKHSEPLKYYWLKLRGKLYR